MSDSRSTAPAAKPHINGNANLRSVAIAAVTVAVLYFAREIFLPFAMAVLLSFVLAPLARRLEKLKLGRTLSVVVSVLFAFVLFAGLGALVGRQALDLMQALPKYEENLVARVRALRGSGGSMLTDVKETVSAIEKELDDPPDTENQNSEDGKNSSLLASILGDDGVLPVRVVEDEPKTLTVAQKYLGPLLSPLGSVSIIILFTAFILAGREDLRDRVIRLAGTGRVYMTTQALNDAGRRVSRFLLMQCCVNAAYGVLVTSGLYLFGVPNALLWGLLAAIVRFVPFVGNIAGALAPSLLAFAVFQDWFRPCGVLTMFVIIELVISNVVEPWLYGESMGVSMIGVVAAAVFWTWLWGPLGLLLALPLTVCVAVLARHVPQLLFIHVLLSDEPPLKLRYRFYQRLLAQDYDEARTVVIDFLRDASLEQLYDQILVPAIFLAERDRRSGRLADEDEQFVYESVKDMIDELQQEPDMPGGENPVAEDAVGETVSEELGKPTRTVNVVTLAAKDTADHIAALLFTQLAVADHYMAVACDGFSDHEATTEWLVAEKPGFVIVSSVAPGGIVSCRAAVRRIREKLPGAKIIAGMWNSPLEPSAKNRLLAAGADAATNNLSDALEILKTYHPILDSAESSSDCPVVNVAK